MTTSSHNSGSGGDGRVPGRKAIHAQVAADSGELATHPVLATQPLLHHPDVKRVPKEKASRLTVWIVTRPGPLGNNKRRYLMDIRAKNGGFAEIFTFFK